MMPNRTIYVSETDAPIFERAQAISKDSLSATIIKAVRSFVEREGGKHEGFQTVSLKVGANSFKRFQGKLILRWVSPVTAMPEEYQVFLTPKRRVVVYVVRGGALESYLRMHPEIYNQTLASGTQYSFDVYDEIDNARGVIPDELFRQLAPMLAEETVEVEELDI